MARRLALLALLAFAVALHRPPQNSENVHRIASWDYGSDENTPHLDVVSIKPSAKVILKDKAPKTNVNMKNKRDKNKVIKTSINIESYTNFLVTKPPVIIKKIKISADAGSPYRPVHDDVDNNEETMWVDVVTKRSNITKRPTTRRPISTRRATVTRKPTKMTHRPSSSTRRTTTHKVSKKTKSPSVKKTTCPPKNAGFFSSFFQDNKLKKSPKKEDKAGIFKRLYKWLWGSRVSWFQGWFQEGQAKKSTTTTTTSTTPEPLTTSTNNWFQIMLNSEENEETSPTSNSYKNLKKKSLKKNYKGYQLLRAYPDVKWKVQEMLDLQEDGQGSGLMWWTPPSMNGSTDFLVPPDLLEDVREHLNSNKIEFDVIIFDLQKAISYENPRLSKKQRIELEQLRGHPMTWRRYHRYADILRYLEYLQHSHSDVVELVPLGRSSEGLPLIAVKVSLSSNDTEAKDIDSKGYKKWRLKSYMKPAIWLDGGAHAREWIAPAVATWMLHALVEGEKGLGPDYEMLKLADFYILPIMNPDGYEHTHTHDRLWMKTRSRLPDHSNDYYVGWFPWNWGSTECIGVNTDRNWDYQWSQKDSSSDPCSDNYAGPHPFSEPETRAVSEFLSEHRGQIKVYLSLHAYSQAWLLPSSHALATSADDGIMLEMGKMATAALADMYGTKYQVGTIAEIRQPASGMSHDWAKARAGIKFSYHVDLRDSFGPYGFLLPGSQIVSTARETWQAVKAIVYNLRPG